MEEQRIRRGEVWYYSPPAGEPGTDYGHIQRGERPVIIVSNDLCNKYSSVVLAVTCTRQPKKNLPTHVLFTIDGEYNTALVEQPTPIQAKYLKNRKYVLDTYLMDQVDEALKIAYGLKPVPGRENREEDVCQQENFQVIKKNSSPIS